ncbi:MAG: DUF4173 domain-containing protein [Bacteroidota bacterium]
MKKEFLTDTLVLLIAFTYCTIFWKEKMGLNSLIFAVLMTGSLVAHYEVKRKAYFWLTAFGTIITAAMIVIHNSLVSKIIHLCSMVTMIGFAQQRMFRFVWYAFLLGIYSMLETPKKFVRQFNENFGTALRPVVLQRNLQLSIAPVFLLGLFYMIYYHANGKFAELSDHFWMNLWSTIVEYFPLQRLLLFAIGGLIAGGALWKSRWSFLERQEEESEENLIRYPLKKHFIKFKILDLKKEYQQGFRALFILNLLLFIVNCIDVRYVWFGFEVGSAQEMKQYVHEGTYLLIVAILLAMAVLLIVFRGKINFFSKNLLIKRLAYTWIVQNAILALSVAIRNYRYIEHYNLAYKRIGVFIFLSLVFIGLLTFFLKIRDRKTTYYLLHRNAIAAYCIWMIVCCVNWDVFITRYNLAHAENGIDTNFLINKVSTKNLFLIEDQTTLLAEKDIYYTDRNLTDDIERTIEAQIQRKRAKFESNTEQYGWLSWNYSDWKNRRNIESRTRNLE